MNLQALEKTYTAKLKHYREIIISPLLPERPLALSLSDQYRPDGILDTCRGGMRDLSA
jgi:hypothetical protein